MVSALRLRRLAVAVLVLSAACWAQEWKPLLNKVFTNSNKSYTDGSKYRGNLTSDKKLEWWGVLYDTDDNSYCFGKWANNKLDGCSMCLYANGDNSKYGVISYTDGSKYVGETKNGKADGHGVVLWTNGDAWYGHRSNGSRSGEGIYLWHNGTFRVETCNGSNCSEVTSPGGCAASGGSGGSGGTDYGIKVYNNAYEGVMSGNKVFYYKCDYCNGGIQQCYVCSGTGQIQSTGITGYSYYGSPLYGMIMKQCFSCYGMGGKPCGVCNGQGKNLANVEMGTINGKYYAPVSGGGSSDGISGGYGGGSSGGGSSGSSRTCVSCGGTGTCKLCGGSGYNSYNVGKYTGTYKQQVDKCNSCKGTGRCWACSRK